MKKLTQKQSEKLIDLIKEYGSASFSVGLCLGDKIKENKRNDCLYDLIDYIQQLTRKTEIDEQKEN